MVDIAALIIIGVVTCANGPPLSDTIPAHQTFTMASAGLAEHRIINVYLPPGYATSRQAFPVLYMPDGGIAEDFPHIVTTIDSLIRHKQIQPVIDHDTRTVAFPSKSS